MQIGEVFWQKPPHVYVKPVLTVIGVCTLKNAPNCHLLMLLCLILRLEQYRMGTIGPTKFMIDFSEK